MTVSLDGDSRVTLEHWEKRTELPLIVLALAFLVILCLPIIAPGMNSTTRTEVAWLDKTIWALFALDYAVRLRLASERRRFVRTHLPDLAVVLLPALRPLRLLRLFSLAQMITRRTADSIVVSAARFVAMAAALLVFVASVGVLNFERPAKGATITDFGDALWWACTTITTVGYGDRYPVTWEGRVIAVALMVLGLALLGVLTASIAAWFVAKSSHEPQIEAAVKVEARELLEVRDRLAAIERHLLGQGEGDAVTMQSRTR